ncbi:MAG: hypothetical protein HZB16_23085 [Armatimonadetes bacterium]|nr:hypothetical protein [Armatimonadota bacterium]
MHVVWPATVREDFPDTLLWAPDITTDANGEAELPMRLADNLTTWQASALAISGLFDLGVGSTTFTTTKDLLVRLIAPAALTQGDEAAITALPAWSGERPVDAQVSLAADGGRWLDVHESRGALARGGDTRLRSTLRVDQPGQVSLTATAATETQADAMRLRVPIAAHGVEQYDRRAAVATAGRQAQADLALPPCQTGTQRLRLTVTASRAGTLLDAAAWVARQGDDDEPADTWQAASRALMGNIALRVARWAGPPAESPEPPQALRHRRGGGIKGKALSEVGLDTAPREDGGYGWRPEWPSDPEVSAFAGEALTALLDRRPVDGEDTIWSLEPLANVRFGGGPTGGPAAAPPPYDAGLAPSRGHLTAYLERYLRRAGDASETTAQAAWVVDQVLSRHLYRPDPAEDAIVRAAADRLWAGRAQLGDEGLARLAMILRRRGDSRAATAWRNLVARLVTGPDTASWGYDRDPVSATALGLQAALVLEPRSDLADKAANWLFLNRSGSRWHNAVATARAVAALADWSETRRETAEPAKLTLTVDGRSVKAWDVAKEQVLRFADEVTLTDLAPGAHRVTLAREGQGSAYLGADLTWLSADEPIRATGHRLAVERSYSLVDDKRTVALAAGQTVPTGALLEVELKLRAEVPLDWVTVTVPTPAGCRAVDADSGYFDGGLWCYRQVRERGVDLAVDHLPQGTSTLRYRLRAEAPGRYHALPPQAQAILLPSVSAVGDEQWLVIAAEGSGRPSANASGGEPMP